MSEQEVTNRFAKALKIAATLHTNGIDSLQAATFGQGQWVMAGAGAGMKPPSDATREVILTILRTFEEAYDEAEGREDQHLLARQQYARGVGRPC